ncbi:hypothetical protein CW745_15175 [Psychromonas sp. psych-6C06]|uniref:hypothetical protein n=1 Tax=Psychromonas sp. psych-6C06 TaxID=2058089 RepID=UPI000C327D74|nr:hypothetical protein [Psychromonas sp. psych-6C06]PKF60405.1 hypothetical protein CW745_15175 [Psychromonas sp. psych-6C06]
MDSLSFDETTKIETKLNGIYQVLYKKENLIADKINRFAEKEKCNNAHHALYLHLLLNIGAVSGLYYLLC